MSRRITPAIGGLLILVALVCALLAPWIAPADPVRGELTNRLKPPGWLEGGSARMPLGADPVGRDLLSRIVYGARVSLFVGMVSAAIALGLGVLAGLVAGYYGGPLDDLLMRLADGWLAFPFILLAILVLAVLGPGLTNLVLVLGIAQWPGFARVVRGQVLSIKALDFIEAARALGAPDRRIAWRHVFPGTLSSIIVVGTLNVANNILLEAGLTYVGLGVDPSIPSWGGMLADGRNYVATAWWVSTFPGLAIMGTVLGFNLVGDWLRDWLDPKLRV